MRILERKLNDSISSHIMFVMIADIQLKEGAEENFKKWFAESNKTLCTFPGFISRKFLKSPDGTYRILVEHESKETFIKMHQSPEHEKLHSMATSYMEKLPEPKFYTVVSQ